VKKYELTEHAKSRVIERLGIAEHQADNYVNQILQTAYFNGITNRRGGTARIFDNINAKVRLIVDINEDKVVTVYRFPDDLQPKSLPEAFADDIRDLVKRKYKSKETEFKRKQRALEIDLAEFNLEFAQLTLNELKAKSPKTRESIGIKINEVKTKIDRIQYEINQAIKNFDEMTKEIAEYV
jgi:hypothetical protein